MRIIGFAVVVLLIGALCFSARDAAPAAAGPQWRPSTAPLAAEELAQLPARIDVMVAAGVASQRRANQPAISDDAFLRRASLDLIGRIPTPAEQAAFAEDRASGRRERLIDRLLAHPGHALHRYGFYADLLRVQSQMQNRFPGQAYSAWLLAEARANRPWDQLVRSLLTASGAAFVAGNGATGFWLRDAGMPLDRVALEVQAFMGTRIGCAQCHDHPTDSWTRKQFYEIAAHTAGTRVDGRRAAGGNAAAQQAIRRAFQNESPEVRNIGRNLGTLFYSGVTPSPAASLALADDYQYPDAKPGERVTARPPWSDPLSVTQRDARVAWARWMTSADNPRFAAVMANRLWTRLMGYSLVDGLDQWTDATRPSDPELLDLLARTLVAVGFDLDRFEAILCRTDSYRRAAIPEDTGAGHRPGPILRRLSAEQIWDSVIALSRDDPEAAPPGDPVAKLHAYVAKHQDDSPQEIVAEAKRLVALRQRAGEIERELRQVRADRAKREALREELEQLREMGEMLRGPRGPGRNAELRAAHLPQPAPAGHALRILGQSDRELIDNADTRPNVTQALLVINGLADRLVVNRKTSLLMAHLAGISGSEARVAAAYRIVLGREPTAEEQARALAGIAADATHGVADLVWTLMAATEFSFRS